MRSSVLCVLIHLVHTYGLEELDCTAPQLLMEESYCNGSHTTLAMRELPQSSHKINLAEYMLINTGCLIDSDVQMHNNKTFYIECETEYTDCVEHEDKYDGGRNVFVVECEDVTVDLPKQMVEAEAKAKNLTMPILVGSSAAACGAVGLGFLAYKLKTLFQSGSYLIPA